MKISKLFHWLYAFLMFLPVLALAPSLFYFAFNQQSQNYTDVQVNETYEYETNEVNSVDDLVVGNIYKYEINTSNFTTSKLLLITNRVYFLENEYGVTNWVFETPSNLIWLTSGTIFVQINGESRFQINSTKPIISCYVLYQSITSTVSTYENFSVSDYLGEKNVDVVRSEQSPMNIFYTAVNYVYDMPVFSWAKNSFLALPITYVTGLFGMASTNVVNYYLSYWLAISIVYLVFDLVMYVPMLVHRWIDKGMIE